MDFHSEIAVLTKSLINTMRTEIYNHNHQPLAFCQNNITFDGVNTYSQQDAPCQFSTVPSEKQIRRCLKEKISDGNYAVAISLLDELIARYPMKAMNYNNRGLIYFRNNQISEALDDLNMAIAMNPKLDSAYNNRANCHAARGNLVAAIADYDLALDLNPANLRAWINQGITYREMNAYDLALENLEIALFLSNSFQERIYAERGRTYHLQGDWNCAVADYQTALAMMSELPDGQQHQKIRSWLDELLAPLRSCS